MEFNNDSYIAVTSHFVDENFKIKSVLLECSILAGSHTSYNLAQELQRIVTAFNLRDKITLAVSDNAANIKKTSMETSWLFCTSHQPDC